MTDIEAKIANLSPEKQELLRRHLVSKSLDNHHKMIRNQNSHCYPASFTQTRFWFLNQLEPDSPVYNTYKALKFSKNLDQDNLEKALGKIITRHETLRTIFKLENEELKQIVVSDFVWELPIINLRDYCHQNEQEILKKLANQIIEKPFNLAKDLMLRATLFRLTNNEYILLLVTHHIISDHWSSQILIKELLSLYKALEKNEPNPCLKLPIQYGDFAIWQKKQFEQKKYQQQLNYWQKKLGDQLPILNLPCDKKRPLIPSYQGGRISFFLSKKLFNNLQKFSQQQKVTLFMVFLTAFSILLYRYTGQEDLIIGTPIAGRQKLEIENLIGCFLNTLALRNNLDHHLTFKELLQQFKQVCLEAYQNQDLPFEKLIEELQPDRNLNQSPIFQVMFNFTNTPEYDHLNCPSFQKRIDIETSRSLFDLSLYIKQKPKSLEVIFEYSNDLFELATIERMKGHFQTLLTSIINYPDEQISSLPLLTKLEKEQILINWNNSEADYPQNQCIQQLFQQQVAQTPHNIAVVWENQQLTYQQLNEKANQLAQYLRKLGVQSETQIGICVEPSLVMIIGILAILKAGGAYVALNPDYPLARLQFIVENANIEIVLTQKLLLNQLASTKLNLVCLDESCLFDQENKANPITNTTAHSLAYIIFTSGSTGKPKGVLIEHQSLCNLAYFKQRYFEIIPSQRVLQFFSLDFDGSVWTIFPTLISGASLYLTTIEQQTNPDALVKLIKQKQITMITLPPSVLKLLPSQDLPCLKNIVVGGETCPIELAQKWSDKYKFFNAYGPTESTVCATISQILPNASRIDIGHPISNVKVYILNQNYQVQPIGVSGEIYLGGDGLARGYLNHPQLNAAKFIPNPFGEGRLYQTGDWGRYLANGKIEFLGRIDEQVKIRGLRIELGEIEANLNLYSRVQQSLVMIQENGQGEKFLAAYIVKNQNQLVTKTELREFLQQKLARYLIPSTFIFLTSFPLTANGKIDKKSLPKIDLVTYQENEFIPPSNEVEIKLAQIWQEVLKVGKISVNDNFFALGGHSLLATQIVSRLNHKLAIELPLRSLFEFTTIRELSKHLSNYYLVKSQKILPQNQARERGEI